MLKKISFLSCLAFVASSAAFSPYCSSSSSCSRSRTFPLATTALNLLPTQGKQLEAAMNAAYVPASIDMEEEDIFGDALSVSDCTKALEKQQKKMVARAFVSRVFSLPSSMIRRHPHPNLEGLPNFIGSDRPKTLFNHAYDEERDDVVLFPLVGFRFVQDRVLPTQSNPSCRLRNIGAMNGESFYGSFSPACHLDIYSHNYAAAPDTN